MTRFPFYCISLLTALLGTALWAGPAAAYVGPGPGLTMMGSLIGLVGSVLVALLMVLLWPIRLYYKKIKARQRAAAPSAADAPADRSAP